MRRRSPQTAKRFPEEVREAAVQQFLTTDLTLGAIADQFGTTRFSVANWVKLAETRGQMKKPKPHLTAAATASAERSGAEKLRLLLEASSLSEEQLGEFLRREGLRDGDLERFRTEALSGLEGKVHSPQDRRQIQELERVNAKQAKRLREAEVLLELQKKVQELWGEKDDDTTKD
jgi:transposase-like protein